MEKPPPREPEAFASPSNQLDQRNGQARPSPFSGAWSKEIQMARKKQESSGEFVIVHVLYDDGTQRSNRKVPRTALSGFDDEVDIKQSIEEQDRNIAPMSRLPPPPVKTITPVR